LINLDLPVVSHRQRTDNLTSEKMKEDSTEEYRRIKVDKLLFSCFALSITNWHAEAPVFNKAAHASALSAIAEGIRNRTLFGFTAVLI